ncbi:hypothetical protein Dxin01_01842 [Deinococcus xinjiangensis]|uniref:N-acetyltransferase domain-containing protein n=1 Tax=Deinococcus xinjiangensis TaxID=457454 RepID=A0ABP9VFJ1_9DEIO
MIRPFVPADAPAYSALWNLILGRKSTPASVLEEDERAVGLNRRWVLEEGERVLGLAHLAASPFAPPDSLYALTMVDPAARGQGRGEALWQTLLAAAQAAGVRGLSSEVADTDPQSLAWAERRGFAVQFQRFASELDLLNFGAAAFAPDLARVAAQGVTFADLGGANAQQIDTYLNFVADRLTETPDLAGHPRWPLAEVAKLLHLDRAEARPEWLILALNPKGEWLGTTALLRYGDMAYNEFTATQPQARGRGLALPLKLEAIARAQAAGLSGMRTNNHSANAPMLAVNRRLGFVPKAGKYELYWSR